eukprot:2498009-Prymnesium_polylepis.1
MSRWGAHSSCSILRRSKPEPLGPLRRSHSAKISPTQGCVEPTPTSKSESRSAESGFRLSPKDASVHSIQNVSSSYTMEKCACWRGLLSLLLV